MTIDTLQSANDPNLDHAREKEKERERERERERTGVARLITS